MKTYPSSSHSQALAVHMRLESQRSIQHGLALCDNRGIGKPTTFGDQQEKFQTWSRKFTNFVVGVYGEDIRRVLDAASTAALDEARRLQKLWPTLPPDVRQPWVDKATIAQAEYDAIKTKLLLSAFAPIVAECVVVQPKTHIARVVR